MSRCLIYKVHAVARRTLNIPYSVHLVKSLFRFFIAHAQNLTHFSLELARLTSAQLIYQIQRQLSTPFFNFSWLFFNFFQGNNIYGFPSFFGHKICVLPRFSFHPAQTPQQCRHTNPQNPASKYRPPFCSAHPLAQHRQ